jgi:hypothetical protein
MRSNAVGGGNSYFMLGVGGCNYDASTILYFQPITSCSPGFLTNKTPTQIFYSKIYVKIIPAVVYPDILTFCLLYLKFCIRRARRVAFIRQNKKISKTSSTSKIGFRVKKRTQATVVWCLFTKVREQCKCQPSEEDPQINIIWLCACFSWRVGQELDGSLTVQI